LPLCSNSNKFTKEGGKMILSYIIDAFKDLARLTGLPFFIVLMSLFIVIVELFILGVIMLFAVWRIRREMIDLNRKIDLLAQPPEKEPEKEPDREIEEASEKEPERKQYRYRWK
jgi:hypothetical protein